MITELGMLNVKGVTRDLSLGPVTLVQGGNFVGKTAIANAIRIGLLGYDPTLGKLASATYGLASGEKMMVNLALDTGATVCRTWELKRGKLVTGGDRDPLIEPMILDHNAYFGMTKQARVDYILGLAAEGAIGQEDITSAMQEIRRPIDPEAKPESFAEWKRMELSVLDLLGAMEQEGATTTDVVDTLIESWTEAAKAAKALVAQMSGATQATEQLAQEGPAARDQTRAIGEKQAAIELLAKSHGVMAERAAKRRKLEHMLVAEINAEQVGANEQHVAELLRQLADLRAEAAKDLASDIGRRGGADYSADVQRTSDEVERLQKEEKQQYTTHGACVAQLDTATRRLEELRKKAGCKTCPSCGAEREHWTVGGNIEAEIKAQETLCQLAASTAKVEREKHEKMLNELEVARGTVREARQKLTDWYTFRDIVTAREKRIQTLSDQIDSASKAGGRVTAAREALDASGAETAEVLTQRVNEIQATIEAARGELRTLQAEQNRYARQCQQKLHAQQAAEERAKQEQRLEILTEGVKAMKALKEWASTTQWDGFIGTINLFCIGLLKEPIAFFDGDIGYTENGRWVSHETMSGMEQALVYIGLGVALAAKSKIKIVVMDEMGILDRTNEGRVIETMKQLVETGVISQFVGMTSRAVEDIDGVEMIRL